MKRKSLFLEVTLIGRPNSGKSSLINAVMGREISLVSPIVQSTRDIVSFLYSKGDTQLIFTDTPGISLPLDQLGKLVQKRSLAAIKESEFVLFLTPINEYFGYLDKQICSQIKNIPNKIALISKIDLAKDPSLLAKRVNSLKNFNFKRILSVSVNFKDSISDLIKELKGFATLSQRIDEDSVLLNKDSLFLAREAIREAIYKQVYLELPHSIAVAIKKFEEFGNSLSIEATIFLIRNSQVGIIIGKDGNRIKKIKKQAIDKLTKFFNFKRISLDLKLKVAKNWNKNYDLVKRLNC